MNIFHVTFLNASVKVSPGCILDLIETNKMELNVSDSGMTAICLDRLGRERCRKGQKKIDSLKTTPAERDRLTKKKVAT